MGIFGQILDKVKLDIDASEIINELSNDDKKMQIKNELTSIVLNGLTSLQQAQASVIIASANGNLLQRSWRPVMMLAFGFILVCKWFGWTDADIPVTLELELMGIIKLGLGGFIIGRSTEKVVQKVTENIDLPFLRKKDRK